MDPFAAGMAAYGFIAGLNMFARYRRRRGWRRLFALFFRMYRDSVRFDRHFSKKGF